MDSCVISSTIHTYIHNYIYIYKYIKKIYICRPKYELTKAIVLSNGSCLLIYLCYLFCVCVCVCFCLFIYLFIFWLHKFHSAMRFYGFTSVQRMIRCFFCVFLSNATAHLSFYVRSFKNFSC